MAWTTYDEIRWRDELSEEAQAKLGPMPERLARLVAERQPYRGVERRSLYSRTTRDVVRQALVAV